VRSSKLIFLFTLLVVVSSCTKDRIFYPEISEMVNDTVLGDSGGVFLNEILAASSGSFPDPADGSSDDWFEICNTSNLPVDLSGFAFSDDFNDPQKAVLPDNPDELTIPAGGFLIFWADDTPSQGVRHLGFKLSSTNGDLLIMSNPSGELMDSVAFGPQTQEVSLGRSPDGRGAWKLFTSPSPGRKNQ
jgi:hypothetical protein